MMHQLAKKQNHPGELPAFGHIQHMGRSPIGYVNQSIKNFFDSTNIQFTILFRVESSYPGNLPKWLSRGYQISALGQALDDIHQLIFDICYRSFQLDRLSRLVPQIFNNYRDITRLEYVMIPGLTTFNYFENKLIIIYLEVGNRPIFK